MRVLRTIGTKDLNVYLIPVSTCRYRTPNLRPSQSVIARAARSESGPSNRQLPSLFLLFLTPFRINTYRCVSKQTTLSTFRMNTYAKMGGGGSYGLTRPRVPKPQPICKHSIAGIRRSFPHFVASSPWQIRAARPFAPRHVPDVLQIFNPDFARVIPVASKIAQERKKRHALAQRSVSLRIFPVRDQVQNLFPLSRRALQINLSVLVRAPRIEPQQPAAELHLKLFVLARQQIDKFRRARFDRSSRFFILRQDRVAQRIQRLILMRIEELRRVLPRRRRSLFVVHHLMRVL